MHNFKDDENLIDLSEHLLNIKSLEKICSLDELLNIVEFYLRNKKINKFILNFTSVNAMEILRFGITRKNFEEKMILIFGFICENSNVEYTLINSIHEFLEEFKSILFYRKFVDCNTDLSDESVDSNYNSNISDENFLTIKKLYLNLSNKIYLDEAFVNFLENYLRLSTSLNTLQI